MKYKTFEELPVWEASIGLAREVYAFTGTGCLKRYSGLRDQVERATLSISNNIAEGFERGTHDELLTFLYIAKGSAAEVRSMLHLMERLPDLADHHQVIQSLRECVREITYQMNCWLAKLRESQHQGPRFKTLAVRQSDLNRGRRTEFSELLNRIRTEHNLPPSPGS